MAKKNENKLTEAHKQVIIRMLGAYYNFKDVRDHLKQEYGIEISDANVSYYKKHRRQEIREARQNFLRDIEVLPVSDKAYRIKLRQDLIKDAMANLWLDVLDKDGNVLHQRGNHAVINKILDSIQSELEPKKIAQTDPTGETGVTEKWEALMDRARETALEITKQLEGAHG
jgi:hypothetical protein